MATSWVMSSFAVTAITLQLLISPASASPHLKYIDAVCDRSHDISFCMKTLTEYPPTAAPIGLHPMAEAVMGLAVSHAEKTGAYILEHVNKDPKIQSSFDESHKAYLAVVNAIKNATAKLKESPDTANFDIINSMENMKRVTELVGKNTDEASTTLMEMNLQMEKLLDLAAGAADAVDDDDENVTRRE